MRIPLRTALMAAVLAAAAPAAAQVSIEARIGGALDSLGFLDGEPDGRSSAAGSLALEYLFAEERARLDYSFDAATYATPGDWTTLLHDLGGVYRVDFGGADGPRLFLGASAAWRDNGDAWAAAGYRALSARGNLELRPGTGATLRLGYRIDGRDFSDLPELNQLEQDGFASAHFDFQTRTTLIGEVHLGVKSYEGAAPSPVEATSPATTVAGRGRGRMGPSLRPGTPPAADAGERAGRVAWLVRAAQSLADRTGLALQYGGRHTFGEAPPVLVTTPAHFFDDGVYDDPYASDGRAARATLTQELGPFGTARAWGVWEGKDYAATPALGPDGEPSGELREDRLWRAGAGWTVPLFPERTGALALDLDVGYGFVRHRSNEAFYDYTSHAVRLSLSVAY